jgi:DNA polymerase III alpha subunit
MHVTKFGEVILNEQDIFQGLYSGKISDIADLNIEDPTLVAQINNAVRSNADQLAMLTLFKEETDIDQAVFDKVNQSNWFMPDDYYPNIVEMLYGMCETNVQIARVSQELELFIQHGMFEILVYLKYLVDTLRTNNIVWGVGRGSSVASYCLYLLGVHKVDSIKYDLDIHEFLK